MVQIYPRSITGTVFHKSMKFQKEILVSESLKDCEVCLVGSQFPLQPCTDSLRKEDKDDRQLLWKDLYFSLSQIMFLYLIYV